jgi:predicted P-loop ATPase
MVARVEEPGCKADHALVLEGLQGIKKSTICNALASDAWFSDNLPNIGGHQEKDAQQHTLGKWLIEIAELGAMKKADIEDVKKFISRRIEKFRPPYGRNEIQAPRQCVFIGTTNADTYLTDDTGNRRFWPVLMTKADIPGLRRDAQQFFAEALVAYQAGEKWWPDEEFEKKFIKPEQDLRFVGDPWEEQIDYYVRKEMGKNAQYRVTTNNVASMGLGVTPDKMNTGISRRIAAALKRLGWWQMKSGNNTFFLPPVALVEELCGEAEAKVVPIPKSRKPKKY